MKHLPKININYLNYIKDNNSYYQISPIEVKRQIWLNNEGIFLSRSLSLSLSLTHSLSIFLDLYFQELNPLFDKCLQYFDEQLSNIETTTHNNKSNTNVNKMDLNEVIEKINSLKFKRQSSHINDIVKMIGNNGKLYFNAVNYSLKLFLSTKNWNYASIRSQLTLKLHDVDVIDLNSSENIYKFTWSLTACIKDRKIESKKIKELESIVDSKKFDKILP